MKIMGIDPGLTGTGVVIIEDKKLITSRKLCLYSTHAVSTMRYYGEKIEALVEEYSPDIVYCEEPFLQGKANKTMMKLLGAIEVYCPKHIRFVHPMSVKSHFKSVKKDKEYLAGQVRKRLGLTSQKEFDKIVTNEQWDVTDAAAIAFYGMDHYKDE